MNLKHILAALACLLPASLLAQVPAANTIRIPQSNGSKFVNKDTVPTATGFMGISAGLAPTALTTAQSITQLGLLDGAFLNASEGGLLGADSGKLAKFSPTGGLSVSGGFIVRDPISAFTASFLYLAAAGNSTVYVPSGAVGNLVITSDTGTVTNTMLAGSIDLATKVTGTLPVANGGTGATTLTANNVILGNGTSAVQFVAPGTSGNVLTSNGTTWTSAAAAGAPGGATTQIQFNNAGAFDGDANLLWDDTNARLQVGSSTGAFQARQAAVWSYNTSVSETNYERGGFYWSGNALYMGAENGGTGTGRTIAIRAAGQTVLISDGSTITPYRSTNPGVDLAYGLGSVSARWSQVASGGVISGTEAKTANYTATATDHVILCDATSGNITITLPAASSHKGRQYVIKKIDASGNTVTIDGNASETIDDATTQVISTQYAGKTIQSDNTEWWIIGSF